MVMNHLTLKYGDCPELSVWVQCIPVIVNAERQWSQSQDEVICKGLNQPLLALKTAKNYEPHLRMSEIKDCNWNNFSNNINIVLGYN